MGNPLSRLWQNPKIPVAGHHVTCAKSVITRPGVKAILRNMSCAGTHQATRFSALNANASIKTSTILEITTVTAISFLDWNKKTSLALKGSKQTSLSFDICRNACEDGEKTFEGWGIC